LWDAAGYAVKKNTGYTTKYLFDVYYIEFGRNSNINGGGGSPIK
jgi:hypothetical protein